MPSTSCARILNADEAAALAPDQVVELSRELVAARQQLDWFKRQIFGQKSEKRFVAGEDGQMSLGEVFAGLPEHDGTPAQDIPAHRRRTPAKKTEAGEALPFFDEHRVPVETIELTAPETEGLSADEFELIGHKESYRLAQRPGSYVVLKYRRSCA
jgi:hypothetical protein